MIADAIRDWIPEPRDFIEITPEGLNWHLAVKVGPEERQAIIQRPLQHFIETAYKNHWEVVFVVGRDHLVRGADPHLPRLHELMGGLLEPIMRSSLVLYRRPDGTLLEWKRRYGIGPADGPKWDDRSIEFTEPRQNEK